MSVLTETTAADVYPLRHTAGIVTLERMASVEHYNRWIFERIAGYLGESVLEVGCGIGNMTPFFANLSRLTCVDISAGSVAVVKALMNGQSHVRVMEADVASPALPAIVGEAFDCVVCINVLEHISHDGVAVANMLSCLKPGGRLVLFVPALAVLYGTLDQALGHYRRYSEKPLNDLLVSEGGRVIESCYMNLLAVPGWFLASRVLHREAPPRGLLSLFNFLAPALKRLEDAHHPPIGQSILVVCEKTG